MYRYFICLLLCAALASADVVEQGPKDSAPSGLRAGVARVDITPPVGIAQMNWGSQTHVTAVGADPAKMLATALVLESGVEKFAMVDIDRLFVDGLEEAIARASQLTGIPAGHIRLGATHTHAGALVNPEKGPPGVDLQPLVDMVERYRVATVDQIVGAIVAANRNLQPAHIHGGRGQGTINVNRRYRAQGRPLAVLANFQCHGTVLAYENKHLSPDWIGMTRRVVEDAFPSALALYFQGAAGNQGPIEGFTGDLEVAHRLGKTLGHQVAAVALQIETVRREPAFEGFVESTAYQAKQHWRVKGPRDSTMRFASTVVETPRRSYSVAEISEMRARVERAQKQLADAESSGDEWKVFQAGARVRRFADLLAKWTAPQQDSPVEVEIQALRIGELVIVAMPGEPFAEIGAEVRKRSPFAFTMFCGYSEGIGGNYMPTAEEYAHGGYKVERTPYGPGADRAVIESAVRLLESLRR